MRTFYRKEIAAAAEKYQLDPLLVEAIVLQESGGNTDAFRFERDLWNRLLKPQKFYNGKNPRRVSSSYGLLQILYCTAIDRGFSKDLPPELLFVPETGLDYGCKHLRVIIDRIGATYAQATPEQQRLAVLASYNGGFQSPFALRPRNADYAKRVMAIYAQLTKDRAPLA